MDAETFPDEKQQKDEELGMGLLARLIRGKKAELEAMQEHVGQLQNEYKLKEEEFKKKPAESKKKKTEMDNMKNNMGKQQQSNQKLMFEIKKSTPEIQENEVDNMEIDMENTMFEIQKPMCKLQENEMDSMEIEMQNIAMKILLKREEESQLKKEVSRLEELEKKKEQEISRLGMDKSKFNYAVTGGQGVGKSSLVNGLLGLEWNNAEAAKTDIVACTSVTRSYFYPNVENVVFWDLPGAGTTTHPEESYYEDKALEAFDAAIIVTGDRILDIELKIAERYRNANKPVIFVRSKADKVLQDLAEDEEITMSEAANKFRSAVEENFKQEINQAGLGDIKIFLVSGRAFLPSKVPYKYGDDTSLKGMDETLLTTFLKETSGKRSIIIQ